MLHHHDMQRVEFEAWQEDYDKVWARKADAPELHREGSQQLRPMPDDELTVNLQTLVC